MLTTIERPRPEAPNIITRPSLTVADTMKLQREIIRARRYVQLGWLLTVKLERQLRVAGLSQTDETQRKPAGMPQESWNTMKPFTRAETEAWTLTTLDFLHQDKAPVIARSIDTGELLFPQGFRPLPDIPDPRFVRTGPGDIPPRVPQRLEERACGVIKTRDKREYILCQPVTSLCVLTPHNGGWPLTITGLVAADGSRPALLVNPESGSAYLVRGRWQ